MKKKTKYIIEIFILSIILVMLIPRIYTLCIEATQANNIITAVLYDNSQYSVGGNGIKLTEEGEDITNWNYSDSKFLQINTNIPKDGETYVIGVSVPQELYFVTFNLNAPAGFDKVEFKQNDKPKANATGEYPLNDYSGTAYYTVSQGVTTATIQMEIKYDFDLWNKFENTLINKKDEKAISVNVYTLKGGELNLKESSNINNAYSGIQYQLTHTFSIYVNNSNVIADTVELVYKEDSQDTIRLENTFYAHDQRNVKLYYKSLKMQIQLPYYTDTETNKKYYLELDKDSFEFVSSRFLNGSPDYSIDYTDYENGIVVINFQNYYANNGIYLKYNVKLPKKLDFSSKSVFNFNGGKSTLYTNDNDGVESKISAYGFRPINVSATYSENVSFLNAGSQSVPFNNTSKTEVTTLGGFYLQNKGTGDSNKKHIDILFDRNDTGYIQVTTMRIPVDRSSKNINIKYRLVDDNNVSVYKDENGQYIADNEKGKEYKFEITIPNSMYTTNTNVTWNNLSIKLYRGLLPEEEQQYYFKEIEYDIEKIKAGASLYATAATKSYSSAGNFYGYANVKEEKNQTVYSKITITSEGIEPISYETKTWINSISTTSYNITDISINGDSKNNASIIAGNSLTLSGRVNSLDYPYGTVPWMHNIVIGLLLPNGISVNEESIVLQTINDTNIKPEKVETEDLYNGFKMWKIYAPRDLRIGYATENLAMLENGKYLKFDMQLNTEYYMNQQTIALNSTIYTASYQNDTGVASTNSAAGAFYWAARTDTYDLNKNGSTTDKIGGINESDKLAFEIVPQSASFDIDDSISINSDSDTREVRLNSSNDILTYKLKLNCTNGGTAKNFSYYIPIPKKTSGTDSYMITTLDKIFNLDLQAEPSISGDDLYNIFYTTKEGLNMDNIDDEEIKWITASEVEDFSKVTMIKLLQKNDTIENGSSTTFSLKLMYEGDTFNEEAGNTITYHSAGNYNYSVNGRETEGTFATKGVTVSLNYAKSFQDITLTAAPNRKPSVDGNVTNYTTLSSELPTFINTQKLQITNVETNNVILNTKSYLNSNLNMEGVYANETFGITVSLDGGSEVDILSSASTNPISIGSTGKGSPTTFKYTIYNANSLSDNSTNRYIIVTYTSDNGVTIKQKIIINRELAKAGNPVSSIVAGNRYQLFDDTTKSVAISKNASFTSQFVLEYIPNMYNEKTLKFSSLLPVGTTLTLYDYINDGNPTYWYYKVENETDSISTSDFRKMGYTDLNYVNITETSKTNEIYMIIVDFKNANNTNIENYKMQLEMSSATLDKVLSEELSFNLKDNRTFSIESSADTIDLGKDFTLTYNMEESLGTESNYLGKKLAYVVSSKEELPKDTYITYNNSKYYMSSNKEFIIPMDSVMNGTKSINLKFDSLINSDISEYNIIIDLMVSATSDGDSPLLGEKVASKSIVLKNKVIKLPSIKITNFSNRIITNDELKNDQILTLNYISTENAKLYVELQQKIGSGYQKVTDKLNRVGTNTNHDMGVFEINLNDGENSIAFKFANSIDMGTYRLLFTIKDTDGNVIYEIPYSIIVRDNKN